MFDFIVFDPDKTIKKAEELKNAGRPDRALSLILRSLKSHPEHPFLNLKAFEYSIYAGKERDSFVYFQKAIKSKEAKNEAERILIENLSRTGLEKHREHYFEILVEEFKVKEAKEFFKNLDRKEIESIRERYKKFVDEIYKKEVEKPTKGLLRGLLILSIIEWEYGNYENSRDALKESYALFPEARDEIIEVIEEETRYGKNRIFANFIIGELFYLFEDEKKGVLILERVLEQDENYLEKIKEIFSEKIPETKEGKKFYIKILLKEKNYKDLPPFLEGIEKEDVQKFLDKIEIERLFFEKEVLKKYINYFKEAGLKFKIIDILYFASKNFPEMIYEFLDDAKEVIKEEIEESALRKFIESLKNIKEKGNIIEEICLHEPRILNLPSFSDVMNEVIEEIPEDKKLLEIFALSLFKTKKFEEGLAVTSYILRNFKEDLSFELKSFIEKNKEFLSYYPLFYEVMYEINIQDKKEGEEILLNYFKNFSDLKNEIIVFLEDLGERKKEFIEEILDDIRYVSEREELPDNILNLLKAELCIKKEYFKDAENYYYKAFKDGIKWVRKRVLEIEEKISSPYIKFLKGKILIEDGKIEEGSSYLFFALREEPAILKDVAAFLRNKMEKEKNVYLGVPYLEILIMQKYYEPALKFAEKLLEIKDRNIKGEILSLYAQALWETGNAKEAKEVIKKLFAEKYIFNPKSLIRFFEEKINKGEENAFIYQTLGTLYILEGKPSKAAMSYFNLALLNPSLCERIKNMLVGIESQFPEDIGVKIAKSGIKIISGKEIEGYEEIENIIENFKEALELTEFFKFLDKEEKPYRVFLKALISFHKGEEDYIKYIKKFAFPEEIPEYLMGKIINLLERGIKKGLALWESMLFLFKIYLYLNKKEKIMEYIKNYGIPEDKEILKEFRKFFIELEEDYKEEKSYNFYLGILLLRLGDQRGFFFLEKSLPQFNDKIYEIFEEIKNYKGNEDILLKVCSIKKDAERFKEILVKLPYDYIIKKEEYLISLLEELPYEKEVCKIFWDVLLKEKRKSIIKIFEKIMKEEKKVRDKIKYYLSLKNDFEIEGEEFYKILIENSDKKEVALLWDEVYNDFMIKRKKYEETRIEIKNEEDVLFISRIYEKKGKIMQALEILESFRKRKGVSDRVLKRINYLKRKLYEKPLILKMEVLR
ncbi:MAG: hypothetical protein ABIM83_06475 [candidate division WOR-3 bacterium]